MTNRVPVQDLRIVVTGILIQRRTTARILAEVPEKASEVIESTSG